MEEAVAQPARAYGVRGSICSVLFPWERIQDTLGQVAHEGDLSHWPLAPEDVKHVARVRLAHGPEELLNKFKN